MDMDMMDKNRCANSPRDGNFRWIFRDVLKARLQNLQYASWPYKGQPYSVCKGKSSIIAFFEISEVFLFDIRIFKIT